MKKVLVTLVMFSMALVFFLPILPAEASVEETPINYVNLEEFGKLDFSKPFVPKTEEELAVIRSQEEYEVMITTEQAIARKAELQGRTVEEVQAEFNAESLKDISGIKNTEFATRSSLQCNWIEKSHIVTVRSHKAKLLIIPELCRYGSAGWINKDKKPFMQEFEASMKSFSGTVAVELKETGYYWKVNGNFYNNSTTSHTGTVGINAVFTATYSVGGTSNHYGAITTGLAWVQVST